MKKLIDYKKFFILLIASVLSTLAALPYIFTVQAELLALAPVSTTQIIFLQIVQSAVLFSILIYIGLFLSNKVGFSLPLVQALIDRKKYRNSLRSDVFLSVILAILASILIIIGDRIFIQLGVIVDISSVNPELWKRFLVSFYGGISEEIILRLFLMTLLVWIGQKLINTKNNDKKRIVIWLAIIAASLIFGLGHLPFTATITELTPLIIARALILNGIGGVIFGWLYWKKGLEFAIISHFSADIVLHVIYPFLQSFLV